MKEVATVGNLLFQVAQVRCPMSVPGYSVYKAQGWLLPRLLKLGTLTHPIQTQAQT